MFSDIILSTFFPHLYQWRYATAQASTVWTMEDTTSRSISTVTGLVPATQYLLQVRVLGKQGDSDWSNSAALTATRGWPPSRY